MLTIATVTPVMKLRIISATDATIGVGPQGEVDRGDTGLALRAGTHKRVFECGRLAAGARVTRVRSRLLMRPVPTYGRPRRRLGAAQCNMAHWSFRRTARGYVPRG